MKTKGFTIVEMLTVVGIIAILVGVLIPSLAMVRNAAKNTQQKAQFASIATGLAGWKNDFGEYPPSRSILDPYYTGSQMLSEALLGWDLLGFHPDSEWQSNGVPIYENGPLEENRKQRKGLYVELDPRQVFQISTANGQEGIFKDRRNLVADTYAITDVFGARSVQLGDKSVRVGTPILYYRANLSSRKALAPTNYQDQIYNFRDNAIMVQAGRVADQDLGHWVEGRKRFGVNLDFTRDTYFYEYIRDPRMTNVKWPYRPDSYLLISAGADGIFGTEDDVTNF